MHEFSRLEQPLRRLLQRGPHEAESIAALLAAYISSSSSPQTEVHTFLNQTSVVISRCLMRTPESFEAKTATSFLDESLKLINWGAGLRDKTVEDFLNEGINEIFVALDRILGASRYRLYTIHPNEMCYRGLKSVGMPKEYRKEFDVEIPEQFNKTKSIPFSEPPFKQLLLTKCHVLYGDDIDQIDEESRDWYYRHLTLGDKDGGVPETYTWEFTVDGVAQNLCRFAPESDRFSYSLAFSMDAGVSSQQEYKDRRFESWFIQLLDVLWSSSFGRDLGAFLGYVLHGLRSKTEGATVSLSKSKTGTANFAIKEAGTNAIEYAWNVSPLFIGSDAEPWVGAKNDSTVEELLRHYESLRNHKTYVIAFGPSGSGKEVFLRTLHKGGITSDGPINTVDCLMKLSGSAEDAEVAIFGAERHAYTGAQVSPGAIEGFLQANDRGSVILDELTEVSPDNQKRLRSVLANLQKRPPIGFKRKAGSQVLTPDVRVMATAKLDAPIDNDLKRRFPAAVRIPSWYELTRHSRTAILRWHVENHLSTQGFKRARVSSQLFQFLVSDAVIPALEESNMGFVKNCVTNLFEMSSGLETAELSLRKLSSRLESYPSTKSMVEELLMGVDEEFPDELLIGEDSGFEKVLPSTLQLGFGIMRCDNWGACLGCIPSVRVEELINTQGDEAWARLYFLYAAVWWREVNYSVNNPAEPKTLASKKDDGDFTAPEVVARHFGNTNSKKYRSWLVTETEHQPYQFRCSNRKDNGAGFRKLKEWAEKPSNKRRLFSLTHLMKCALPAFPSFPFWEQAIPTQTSHVSGHSESGALSAAEEQVVRQEAPVDVNL